MPITAGVRRKLVRGRVRESGNITPIQISVDLVCQGRNVRLNLQHHDTDDLRGNEDHAMDQNPLAQIEEIPVYTQNGGSSELLLDEFPRLYSSSCRTFRDLSNQAAFLVIRDPVFDSFKFLGSFVMGNQEFYVQPLSTTHNSSQQRMHVSTPVPATDFSTVLEVKLCTPRAVGIVVQITTQEDIGSQTDIEKQLKSALDDIESLVESQEKASIPQAGKMNVKTATSLHQTHRNSRNFSGKMGQGRASASSNQGSTSPETANGIGRETASASTAKIGSGNREPPFRKQDQQSKPPTLDKPEKERRKGAFLRHFYVTGQKDTRCRRMVELVLVCDYLCFTYFQDIYETTSEVQTKNVISVFFSYLQEYLQISYGTVLQRYPSFETEIKVKIVGIFVASSPDVKIIGTYTLGGNPRNVDSGASLWECAVWVQDNIKTSLIADHYALVTGYELFGNRFDENGIGQVTRIPSICDLDSVSINEAKATALGPVVTHELGHSLGAPHDGLTGGVCTDEQQFIMAAFLFGAITRNNDGNAFRFSVCSAQFFEAILPEKQCLRRSDFNGTPFIPRRNRVGQSFSLDEQCDLRLKDSTLCRDITILLEGSWDQVCSRRACRVPFNPTLCLPDLSLQYTSCGNKRWCEKGFCVDNPEAPEKPVHCPAGDSPNVECDVSKCTSYDDFTRFVLCCQSCRPIKTVRFVVL